MNKELFNKLINAQSELAKRAKEVLKEINEVREIEGFSYLSITSVGQYSVECNGDAYWRYGGHEHYSFEFPSILLYNEEEKKEYIQDILNEIEDENRKKEEQEQKRLKTKEEQDRKKYKELKEQFENK